MRLFQGTGAGLNGHAARNLAHRLEERQPARNVRYCFIGHTDGPGIGQLIGLLWIGCRNEGRCQNLTFPKERPFRWLGLLHLYDHLGAVEDFLGHIDDLGSRAAKCLIGGSDS